jgi:tetratricopeptide (TPR) repeat protein
MKKIIYIIFTLMIMSGGNVKAQIDTDRMTIIGRNALYFEDYILAIQYFNQIIRVKPYLSEPYYYRAIGKYYLEDYNGAMNDCGDAIERNPYLIDAYNLRGILHQKMDNPRASVDDFKKGLDLSPQNVNLLINLGIAYIQTKQYKKAIDTYSRALDKSPNLVTAYLNRGLAKFSAKDTTGALNDFAKAIDVNPYIPDGYVNRAMINYHKGDFDAALSDVENALNLRPEEASLYMNRGIISYQMDDLRGAMKDINKFVELEPRNAMGYNNRGILRAGIGDLVGAIEDFSSVLALRGEDLPTLFYRGRLYKEKGELRKALSDFNVVADAYPDFGPVYMNRSKVRQALGQREAAKLDYNTAMKIEMERRDQIGREDSQQEAKRDEPDDDGETPKRKETRDEDDRNIRNYNKIAVLDDFGTDQPEQLTGTSLRGKIQNRNIMVDLQMPYGITFFPGDTLVHRVRYFERDIENLSHDFVFDRSLEIANATHEVDRKASAGIFETISIIDGNLAEVSDSHNKGILHLERGLLYMSVLNLNNAIDDFGKVIEYNDQQYLAFFVRAFARYKMVETVRDMESDNAPEIKHLNVAAASENMPGDDALSKQTVLDYKLIIDDLEKVTEIEPRFEFAWFNLGYISSILRDFEEAIDHYSKAIELNPDFAEAWFNRGLTRIYLGHTTEGTLDLSKAGELGVFEAYSVIKRYGAYTMGDESKTKEEINK